MAVSYVKFQRGTQEAYDKLLQADRIDENTLYFIYPKDNSVVGKLYLGERLISGGDIVLSAANLDDLADVIVAGAEADSFLVKEGDKWVAKSLADVVNLIAENLEIDSAPAQVFHIELENATADHLEAIAEEVGDKLLVDGDIAIVKSPIAEGKYEHTAYVYCNETWAAMDGNYSAANVYTSSKITLAGDYGKDSRGDTLTRIGNKKIGDEIAAGTSLQSVLMDILSQRIQPSKSAPTATITASGSDGAKETGESYTLPTATLTVTSGSYTYDGSATGVKYLANNVTVAYGADPDTATYKNSNSAELGNNGTVTIAPAKYSANATTAIFTDNTVSYTFSGKAHNEAGNVAKDNLGDNSNPEVKIDAADLTVADKSVGFRGYRKMFCGCTDKELTSDEIRKLSLKSAKADTTAFEVTAPIGATKLVVAAPTKSVGKKYTLSKAEMFTMSYEDYTAKFATKDQIEVADYRGGTNGLQAYNIYVYEFAALAAPTKFKITLAAANA